jgi:DNA primase
VRKEGEAGFRARLVAALPLPDYFFQHLGGQVDLGRLDGRARLAELARALLSKLPVGVLRQLMLARLAELTRLGKDDLNRLLDVPGSKAAPRRAAAQRGPGRHRKVRRPWCGRRWRCSSSIRSLDAISMIRKDFLSWTAPAYRCGWN